MQVGGVPVGSVKGIKITDDGARRDHALDRRRPRAAPPRHARRDPPVLAVRAREPLRRPRRCRPTRERARSRTAASIDTDKTVTAGRPRRALQHARPADAQGAPGLLQGLRATSARDMSRRGERRLPVPEPGAVHLQPPLQRAHQGHPARSQRFLVDSSQMVTALAERRDDLAGLVGNLNDTTRALGSQKEALAESIGRLPPFMRRANTTFVNLRIDPRRRSTRSSRPRSRWRSASGPSSRRLAAVRRRRRADRPRPQPDDPQVRPRERPDQPDADLPAAGGDRDGEEGPQLRARRHQRIRSARRAAPSRRPSTRSRDGATEISFARPYTTDFLGWFDDFSTTGGGFDALGATARGFITTSEFLHPDSLATKQYKRCPGAAEAPAPDGSNVLLRRRSATGSAATSRTGGRRSEARA